MTTPAIFDSVFMAGFECATHRRGDGRRLDLIAGTRHDEFAGSDYRLAASHGLKTVRDGLRWHVIERQPGVYDWSSWRPMLRAAREAGVQVIWDICHYGWPDFIDIWSDAFVESFARFAAAAARVHREESGGVPLWCPVNEISFLTWSGDVGYFPIRDARGRGPALKRQLVRAAIAGAEAVLKVDARARLVWAEPMIHIIRITSGSPEDFARAKQQHDSQFEAFDMIAGRRDADLGGRPALLDVVGLNYYPHNQWFSDHGPTIPMGHHAYKDMHVLLLEVAGRYPDSPLLIAETGAEKGARGPWMQYVGQEVRLALAQGAPVQGVCLYPILAYPGWDNDRTCEAGLFGAADSRGERTVFEPLAQELRRQQQALADIQGDAAGEPAIIDAARFAAE